MTPEISRAVRTVITTLGLTSGVVADELRAAGAQAETVDDLPNWALNVLAVAGGGDSDQAR